MPRKTTHLPLCSLLSGFMLAACGGVPDETGLAPAGETLGTQEAALDCAGAAVTDLTIDGMSSWGGVVSGAGRWTATHPANAVKLFFYIDGAPQGDDTELSEPTSTTAPNPHGGWNFNANVACGTHTFEVRAYPSNISSTGTQETCSTGYLSKTYSFTQGCPTATLSCTSSSWNLNCTGSGSGGTGGPYISYWRESEGTSTSEWQQGSSSYETFCIPATTRDNSYRLVISYKVKDSSGMESPIRTVSRLCAY
jgi:hypothetical protein